MSVQTVNKREHQAAFAKSTFGFWVYLMTDLLMFSVLFAVYAVLHSNTMGGPAGRDLFSPKLALSETLILQSSSAGDIVADPFMGSGSVGAAALKLSRRFLGNDVSDSALAHARARFAQLGGQEGSVLSVAATAQRRLLVVYVLGRRWLGRGLLGPTFRLGSPWSP